jgi:hypothetical protein
VAGGGGADEEDRAVAELLGMVHVVAVLSAKWQSKRGGCCTLSICPSR